VKLALKVLQPEINIETAQLDAKQRGLSGHQCERSYVNFTLIDDAY
jgi:hypothetical protein